MVRGMLLVAMVTGLGVGVDGPVEKDGPAGVIHVDAGNVSGVEDGASWGTAFTLLEDAVDVAGDGDAIWVAAGTYTPAPANDTGSLVLQDGVNLLGGFAGGEASADERPYGPEATVIDGSTALNGGPAFHVLIAEDYVLIDGITITGGDADGTAPPPPVEGEEPNPHEGGSEEGGWPYYEGGPEEGDCRPEGDDWYEGEKGTRSGKCGKGAAGVLQYKDEYDVYGGGVLALGTHAVLRQCRLVGNLADYGGAVHARGSLEMRDCVFEDNGAQSDGGALHYAAHQLRVISCEFTGNRAAIKGGACAFLKSPGEAPGLSPDTWCQCEGEGEPDYPLVARAPAWGIEEAGGEDGAKAGRLVGLEREGKEKEYEGEDEGVDPAELPEGRHFFDCVFTNNEAMRGGALCTRDNLIDGDIATRCSFVGNCAQTAGGVYGEIILESCYFFKNCADEGGAGKGNISAYHTVFEGNRCITAYGALDISPNAQWLGHEPAYIHDCLFFDNGGGQEGYAIDVTAADDLGAGTVEITFSTLADRTGIVQNEGEWLGPGHAYLRGCIVLAEPAFTTPFNQIEVTDSCVPAGAAGEGNIDDAPLFVDAAAGDFRLSAGSPCIDAGPSVLVPYRDLGGVWRPQDGAPDMGAFEWIGADSDGDGLTDETEGTGDTDGDGTPDYLDADSDDEGLGDAEEGLLDVDSDGIPDYLEADSDGDGIFDSAEVARGLDPADGGDGDDDPDRDGLSNYEEIVLYLTDHRSLDTDGDGMPDGWEVDNGLNPLVDDASEDADEDSLSNGYEHGIGSDPQSPDTDEDGIADGVEDALSGLDPTDASDAAMDPDDDGLSTRDELNLHSTNAFVFDTDGDDMGDGWEIRHGLDAVGTNEAAEDPDEDLLPNVYESALDTDPHDAESPPTAVYVAEGGDDAASGLADAPWATLTHAMQEAARFTGYDFESGQALYQRPLTVNAGAGTYEEAVWMVSNVRLLGAGAEATVVRFYDPESFEHVVLEAAAGTEIRDLALSLPAANAGTTVLLRAQNVPVSVENVVFDGRFDQDSTGVLITGTASSASALAGCTFRRLEQGIWAVDSGVNISGNTFEDIVGDAVFVALPPAKSGEALTPLMGDVEAQGTGHNSFRNIEGKFVRNSNASVTMAQNNDWGAKCKADIEAKMAGPVEFMPFLRSAGEGEPDCMEGEWRDGEPAEAEMPDGEGTVGDGEAAEAEMPDGEDTSGDGEDGTKPTPSDGEASEAEAVEGEESEGEEPPKLLGCSGTPRAAAVPAVIGALGDLSVLVIMVLAMGWHVRRREAV